MGERFQIINKFMPDKDFTGCPVGINKGAILYDRLNSVCVLQLKFQNFSKLPIRKLEVQVIYHDGKGNVFETKSSYTGNEKNDGCFGSDRVIELNCDNVLTVDINILKVVLDDSTVWEYAEKTKKFLMPQTKLLPILKRQIARDLGESVANNFSYLPIDYDEYWQCACGKANEGETCIKCGQQKEVVFEVLDTKKVVSNLKNYLKEEEVRASKNRERKIEIIKSKKVKIRITCKLISLILVLFFISWGANRASDEASFYSAVRLMRNQKYSQAVKKFNKLPQEIYEDRICSKIEKESENILGYFQEEEISYEDACNYFDELKEYVSAKDIKKIGENINETNNLNESRVQFEKGKNYEKDGSYAKAIMAFKKVIEDDENYEEAQKYVKEYTRMLVKDANLKLEEYKKSNNYKDALELISEIEGSVDDDKINNYRKYFNAVERGEEYLKDGARYSYRQTLYNSPNKNSESNYYLSNSGNAKIYSYYVDEDFCVWVKIECDDGFYWILKESF